MKDNHTTLVTELHQLTDSGTWVSSLALMQLFTLCNCPRLSFGVLSVRLASIGVLFCPYVSLFVTCLKPMAEFCFVNHKCNTMNNQFKGSKMNRTQFKRKPPDVSPASPSHQHKGALQHAPSVEVHLQIRFCGAEQVSVHQTTTCTGYGIVEAHYYCTTLEQLLGSSYRSLQKKIKQSATRKGRKI